MKWFRHAIRSAYLALRGSSQRWLPAPHWLDHGW